MHRIEVAKDPARTPQFVIIYLILGGVRVIKAHALEDSSSWSKARFQVQVWDVSVTALTHLPQGLAGINGLPQSDQRRLAQMGIKQIQRLAFRNLQAVHQFWRQ